MNTHPYRTLWETHDLEAWAGAVSEDVVVHSPILTTPFRGRARVIELFEVLIDRIDGLSILAEAHGDGTAMFLWRADLAGRPIEGMDVLRRDSLGQINEIRVLIRPMVGLAAFAAAVGPAMARNRGWLNGVTLGLLAGPLRAIMFAADSAGRRLVQGPGRLRGDSARDADDLPRH